MKIIPKKGILELVDKTIVGFIFILSIFTSVGCVSESENIPSASAVENDVTIDSSNSTRSLRTSANIGIPQAPLKLCIYYGYPSLVNGSNYDTKKAITNFSPFDVIVFGDGLWSTDLLKKKKGDPAESARTKQIIAGLTAKGKKVYGYISVGLTGANSPKLTDTQLKSYIDGWKAMGVNGVFADEYGTDYGVYRTRQNVFVDYAHSKGLSVFANSWKVNDALGGNDCHLNNKDYYLLESFGFGAGAYRPLTETMDDRAKLAYYYMRTKTDSKRVNVATIATTAASGISSSSNTTPPFFHSYFATIVWNFDAFGFTDITYSSYDKNANKVYPFTYPITNYGTSFIHVDYVEKKNNALYLRSTNTHNLYVTDKTGYATKK